MTPSRIAEGLLIPDDQTHIEILVENIVALSTGR